MIINPTPIIRITTGGHKVKLILVACDFCKKEALRSWVLYRNTGRYRCVRCANKTLKNEHRRGVAPANAQIKCVVSCLQCGLEKLKTKRDLERAPLTFCGSKCQIRWQRSNTDFQRGVNNSAYKHGRRINGAVENYGPDFTKELRRSIKIRDGFNCQVCRSNFSGFRGKELDIHHIDENKFNNDPSNLVTLCKSCHTSLHWQKAS